MCRSDIVENKYIVVTCNENIFPSGNYLFNGNTRPGKEVYLKLTIKTPE